MPDRAAFAEFASTIRARHEALVAELRAIDHDERDAALVDELFRRYDDALRLLDELRTTAADSAKSDEDVGKVATRLTEAQRSFDAFATAIGLDHCRFARSTEDAERDAGGGTG